MDEITDVKELPVEFTGTGEVRGFSFKQLGKSATGYLYRVTDDQAVWYEVFQRKVNQFGGVSYPKSKSFGVWAWTTRSLDSALTRFNSI